MTEQARPQEFNFPISFTGPDGIGATPFDDYAEAERLYAATPSMDEIVERAREVILDVVSWELVPQAQPA